MGNRTLLAGAATVEIDLARYDELLHKEALFDLICNAYNGTLNNTEQEEENE